MNSHSSLATRRCAYPVLQWKEVVMEEVRRE
jgi:hypothetical protein